MATRSKPSRADRIRQIVRHFPAEYALEKKNGDPWPADGSFEKDWLLGSGGSSAVFRTRHLGRIPRAVKVLVPHDDFDAAESGLQLFAASFDNEITLLSELSHEHIARITHFGTIDDRDPQEIQESYPWVSMELATGVELQEWVEHPDVGGLEIITALQQILDAVDYLHRNDVMHCDIKAQNCVVDGAAAGSSPRAVLLDLGVAHSLPKDDQRDSEYTYFYSTPKCAHPDLRLVMANKSGNRIRLGDLRGFFPHQDLYSIGVLFRELAQNPVVRTKLVRAVGFGGYSGLKSIGEGLIDPTPNKSAIYRSVRDVSNGLNRLGTASLAPLGLRSLAQTGSKGVLLPGAQGRWIAPRSHEDIVNHRAFQRLRYVPQVDLMHYVFPGATHTRFTHALEEMKLARQAVDQQLHNWKFRLASRESDLEGLLYLSLLDSVGRYQLWHMFEDFLRNQDDLADAGLMTVAQVDELLIGAADHPGFDRKLIRDRRGRTIEDLLPMRWQDLRQLADQPKDPIQGFMAGLLESSIDVGKLAYLQADSAATGLSFGRSVDPDAIFSHLIPTETQDWVGGRGGPALGLKEDGISFAENAVLARYWSIQAGYWNRTTRSLQAMGKFVISNLLKAKRLRFPEYLAATLYASQLEALRWLSDQFEQAKKDGQIEKTTVNPLLGLIGSERDAYQRLLTISGKSAVLDRSDDHDIFDKIVTRSTLRDGELCDLVAHQIELVVPGVNIVPGEILLDVPRATRDRTRGRVMVYSDASDGGSIGELTKASPLLGQLSSSFDQYAKRLRVYVHPRVMRKMGLDKEAQAHGAVLEVLRDLAQGGRL